MDSSGESRGVLILKIEIKAADGYVDLGHLASRLGPMGRDHGKVVAMLDLSSWPRGCLDFLLLLSPTHIDLTMADQPSSTAAKKSKKKGRVIVNYIRDLVKRPKSDKDSASQSNMAGVSFSSASGTQYPVPGDDAGSVATASSKYIDSIIVSSMKDLASPDPTLGPFQAAPVPEMPVSDVGQGGLEYALSLRLKI